MQLLILDTCSRPAAGQLTVINVRRRLITDRCHAAESAAAIQRSMLAACAICQIPRIGDNPTILILYRTLRKAQIIFQNPTESLWPEAIFHDGYNRRIE
jgi:hypothetical protein